ncbi:MAG TPA: universal stress protein [Solirubrobacteraceae bacterium]|nr:universal stress protein [Solirubrobacteraceae bacterium]
MTAILIVLVIVLALALAAVILYPRRGASRRSPSTPPPGARRILFPFVAPVLSRRALDSALRLARAEDATLLPVFLARVPLTLPLDAPLPRQAALCLPLQEAIEHRATAFGVPVDARVERGRTYRHALRRTIETEHFERIVMAAASDGGPGFGPDDVAWLLAHAPGEIVVLRPGAEDQLLPTPPRPRRGDVSATGERAPAPDPVRA